MVQRLYEWGVHRIYGYPGDGINGMGALARAQDKIEFIQVRHEEMAAFMACGHAKFTGEVGIGAGELRAGNEVLEVRSCFKTLFQVVSVV
jgi:pyruvate dehydrogenase (quinone)